VAEQRKYNRVPVQFSVTCVQADGISFEGSVRDISVGGMFVECAAPPAFATELTLVLVGVAARELRLPAIVRWSETYGFGVQFGLLGAYATHALVDLMKKTSL
jgi:hypothetical protein